MNWLTTLLGHISNITTIVDELVGAITDVLDHLQGKTKPPTN